MIKKRINKRNESQKKRSMALFLVFVLLSATLYLGEGFYANAQEESVTQEQEDKNATKGWNKDLIKMPEWLLQTAKGMEAPAADNGNNPSALTPPAIVSVASALEEGTWSNETVIVTVTVESVNVMKEIRYSTTNHFDAAEQKIEVEPVSGTISCQFETNKADENQPTYYIWAIDQAGHISETASITINVDYTEPQIVHITNLSANQNWVSKGHDILVEVSDGAISSGIVGIRYKRNGEEIREVTEAAVSGECLIYTIPAGEGEESDTNTYTIWAVDYAGNESEREQTRVYIDKEQPIITNIYNPSAEGKWMSTEHTIIVEVTDGAIGSGITGIHYLRNEEEEKEVTEAAVSGTSLIYTIPVGKGEKSELSTYTIWAIDQVNHASDHITTKVHVDKDKPNIVNVYHPSMNGNWMNTGHTIQVEVSDGAISSGLAGIRYQIRGGEPKEVTSFTISGESFLYTFPVGQDNSDINEYTIWAIDQVGHESDKITTKVYIDKEKPKVTAVKFQEFASLSKKPWEQQMTSFGHFYRDKVKVSVLVEKSTDLTKIAEVDFKYENRGKEITITQEAYEVSKEELETWMNEKDLNISANKKYYQADILLEPNDLDLPYQYNAIHFIARDEADNECDITCEEAEKPLKHSNFLLIEKTPPQIQFHLKDVSGEAVYREPETGKIWSANPITVAAVITDDDSGIYQYTKKINSTEIESIEKTDKQVKKVDLTITTNEKSSTGLLVTPNHEFEYQFSINAIDHSGNDNETSCSVYIDQVNPKVNTIHSSVDGWTNQEEVTISGQVSDEGSGINRVVYASSKKTQSQLTKEEWEALQKGAKEAELNRSTNEYEITAKGAQDQIYYVWAVDNVEHFSEVKQQTVKIDLADPKITNIRILDKETRQELANGLNYLPFGNFYNKSVSVELTYQDQLPSSGINKENVRLYSKKEEGSYLSPVKIENQTNNQNTITQTAYFDLDLTLDTYLEVEVLDNTEHTTKVHTINQDNQNIQSHRLVLENQNPKIDITVPTPDYVSTKGDREEYWYGGSIDFQIKVRDQDSGIRSVNAAINTTDLLSASENTSWQKEKNYKVSTGTQGVVGGSEGSYQLNVTAIDNAGNLQESPRVVFIDTNTPSVVAYRFEPIGYSDGGNVPVTTEDYGYYFRESTRVIVNAQDLAPSSGLDQINYRMIDINGKEITGTEKCVQDQIAFEIPEGFKGKIYTTAIDHVGHIGAEQSLEGIIQENSRLHESTSNIQLLKPETTRKDAQGLDLYNTNIPITMHVEDLYSGIRSIDWKIEAYGDPDQNQSGHLEINNLGELLNDEGWGVVASQHNLRTILEKTIIVQNNSNEIRVTLTFTDRAGNQSSSYIVFSIDKTMPQIDVSYTNNEDDVEFEGFFKEPRIAEIVVTERNFNEKDAILTVTKDGEIISPVLDWSESGGTGNGDDITHTARISYDTDGDYTFAFQYGDLAGNASTDINYGNSATPTEFTIDGTAPVITLSYNNVAATGKGNYYFQEARIGTIQIEEHNFEASRANVIITSKDNNGNDLGNAPTVLPTDWNSVGDKRTAEVAFNAENANYSIAVQYTDQAGNQATPIEEQTFCMDQNDPIIEITGIMDRHAYNQEIIQPVVTFRDVNLDVNQTIITLSGSTLGELDLTGQDNSTADTRTFEFDNIEKDDIYTLFASVTDNAGRSNQIQYRFSVNRLGSTYELSKETSEMNHSYTNSPNDVVVREINVNALSQDSVNVTMSKDNKPSDLRENTDYDLKKEGQDGEWSVYTYTIYKSNFKEDGNYGIRLYSVDEAKNISQNNLDDENKRAEINFHVDKTSPNLSILNLNDGETYPEDSKMVKISVNDNTYVKEIQVRLNEKELKTYHLEEIQKKADQNENYEIEIANSDDSQELQVFALDAAGNSKEAKVVDFYVTTNLWIRFVNNKVVLYSTIMGVILVLASGIAIVFLKKKKPKKQQSA